MRYHWVVRRSLMKRDRKRKRERTRDEKNVRIQDEEKGERKIGTCGERMTKWETRKYVGCSCSCTASRCAKWWAPQLRWQLARRKRVRVGMRERRVPSRARALVLFNFYTYVWPNSVTFRVWETSDVKIASGSTFILPASPSLISFLPCARRGNLDFLIRLSIEEVRTTRVGGKKGTGRDNLPAIVSGWRLSSPPENSVEMMWHVWEMAGRARDYWKAPRLEKFIHFRRRKVRAVSRWRHAGSRR